MDEQDQDIGDQTGSANRRIAELETALEVAKRAGEEARLEAAFAREELEQLAYAAGHDLREPLRTIAAYSQLLEREFSGNKEAAELVQFVTDGVSRMNSIITDLLSYSRSGSAPNPIEMPLTLAAQWAVMNLAAPIRESGAQVTYENLPKVEADEAQMIRLFTNLIDNAIKFRSDQPPQIKISSEQTEQGHVVSVQDNGIGIDPKYQKQVFVVFKRLHGREVPGTGIGLAICQRIVRAHGGQIWVESDGQHGSVFKFTLPT
jgi:light-regulated signal transduction histidine kinase (bacteriophytochrome)